jgi:hypothetical protein
MTLTRICLSPFDPDFQELYEKDVAALLEPVKFLEHVELFDVQADLPSPIQETGPGSSLVDLLCRLEHLTTLCTWIPFSILLYLIFGAAALYNCDIREECWTAQVWAARLKRLDLQGCGNVSPTAAILAPFSASLETFTYARGWAQRTSDPVSSATGYTFPKLRALELSCGYRYPGLPVFFRECPLESVGLTNLDPLYTFHHCSEIISAHSKTLKTLNMGLIRPDQVDGMRRLCEEHGVKLEYTLPMRIEDEDEDED